MLSVAVVMFSLKNEMTATQMRRNGSLDRVVTAGQPGFNAESKAGVVLMFFKER